MNKIANLEDCIPESLFKYREFSSEFHKKIITHQEIYFAKPSEFKVHYDCTYKVNREFLKNELNRRKYYAQNKGEEDLYSPLINHLIENNPIDDKYIDEIEKLYQKEIDEKYGVFSGSLTNRSDNLWKVFGGNHKGFCVELNLLETFPLNFGTKGYVQYTEEEKLPKSKVAYIDDMERLLYISDLIFKLPNCFSAEQEYRINKIFFNEKDRIFKLKKENIKSITLGYKMTKFKRDKIIELIRFHLPNIIIKRLKYNNSNIIEVEC